jgi:hypothetical protein
VSDDGVCIGQHKPLCRDLSKGNFSADNHKQLTGSKHDIPIYRAWVTGDLRLVVSLLSDA